MIPFNPGPGRRQTPEPRTAVGDALAECRRAFWGVALFSGAVNLLMLAGPLYMLQVYDRVLTSRSVPTLIALSVFLVGAYAFQGALDLIRSRVVVRASALLDRRLDATVHAAVLALATRAPHAGEAHQPVRDLDQIRAFLTGSGPIALLDLPWAPAFVAICFLIHPWLGVLSLAGAALLLAMTVRTAQASREPAQALSRAGGVRLAAVEALRRNSETAIAMGMTQALARRWELVNRSYVRTLARASDTVSTYASMTKVLRFLLQSAILGLGAYLVIHNELTAGGMIAASIMMGRALAPIEVAIANWRGFHAARESIVRLSETLARTHVEPVPTALPLPKSKLAVDHVWVGAPGAHKPIVSEVHFTLTAGDVLGVLGPSGSGKTSLARTLVGVWPAMRGVLRIDGAAIDQWDQSRLGLNIGYLSQAVDLFDATVAENIARMALEPDNDALLAAAKEAGAHDMILQLPSGYDTRIGESGMFLSAGQRQRVALARALYRNPFLVVLDEPNSNLDNDGEVALLGAIQNLKTRGAIVILVTHRPAILSSCRKVLCLAAGSQQAFGDRDEVLEKVLARPIPFSATNSGLRVVAETGRAS